MSDLNKARHLLEDIGLSPTEAIIYEYGVSQPGQVGAQEIQKYTDIKRPTVYYSLGQLEAKGLVGRTETDRRVLFSFQPPETLERYINDQVRETRLKLHSVAKVMDLLPINTSQEGLQVTSYEGLQGVKTVIDMTLYCKNKRWRTIAPFKNFLRDYDEAYARYYVHTKRKQKIKAETLWEKIMPDSRPLSLNEIKEKNPRIMPDTMLGAFESIIIIFDNKVAIIGPYSQLSAVVIESKEVQTMFSALFETIWRISTPYSKALASLEDVK